MKKMKLELERRPKRVQRETAAKPQQQYAAPGKQYFIEEKRGQRCNKVADEIVRRGYLVKGVYLSETCHSEAALFTGSVYKIHETSLWVESEWSVSSTVIGSSVTSLYPGMDMDTTVSAAGIVIMRSDGDPEWRDEPKELLSSPNPLGQAAIEGIATGVAGLLLLGSITAAIIVGKNRRKQAAAADRRPRYSYNSTHGKIIYPQAAELADGQPVGAEMGIEGARVSPGTLMELDAIRPPGELQTVERPVEMLGTSAGRALELPA